MDHLTGQERKQLTDALVDLFVRVAANRQTVNLRAHDTANTVLNAFEQLREDLDVGKCVRTLNSAYR